MRGHDQLSVAIVLRFINGTLSRAAFDQRLDLLPIRRTIPVVASAIPSTARTPGSGALLDSDSGPISALGALAKAVSASSTKLVAMTVTILRNFMTNSGRCGCRFGCHLDHTSEYNSKCSTSKFLPLDGGSIWWGQSEHQLGQPFGETNGGEQITQRLAYDFLGDVTEQS